VKRTSIPVIFLSVLILTCAIIPGIVAASTCESCHGTSNPDGGYTFGRPSVSLGGTGAVQPNSTINIDLVVQHPGRYEVKGLQATLDLSKAPGVTLETGETAKKTMGNMDSRPQSHGLSWRLDSGAVGGTATINANVSYTVHFTHNSGGSKDNAYYKQALTHIVEVQAMPFNISPSSLQAVVGSVHEFTLNITATQDIYNLEVATGLAVKNFTQVVPAKIGTLKKGQTRAVTITMTPDRTMEHGTIAVLCSMDPAGVQLTSVSIGVKVLAKATPHVGQGNEQGAINRLAARVLGFIGLILLILLMPTGGFIKGVGKALNKAFGSAKTRVDVHCAMSYMLLSIGLLHAALLMYGHYKGAVWNGVFLIAVSDYMNINLGTIAVVLMCVISLLGILQKRLVKAMGRKAWGWTHGIISYVALAVIIVHLLWIGTTSAPIRALLL